MFRDLTIGSVLLFLILTGSAPGGEVSGRVEMPATCSPTVSPAVVSLERLDGKVEVEGRGRGARVELVNQRGLQFEPRVQAIQVGQSVAFTNDDNETHNVHILTPGVPFNQSMERGRTVEYKAEKPGLLRLVCDIHSHMRGYVLVSSTPYFAVCRTDGRFRLDDVPDGRYRLNVWHEMGRGTSRKIEVKGNEPLLVGTLAVEAAPVVATGPAAAVRPWSEVIDQVGILLGESRALASRPGGVAKGRKLAEDAYFDEFEGSQMETAIRRHLGYQRAGEIEGRFKGYRAMAREVAEGKTTAAAMADRSRELMLSLVKASDDLNRLGVIDRTRIGSDQGVASVVGDESGDVVAQQKVLGEALDGVATLANSGAVDEASSAMTTAYFDAFEPLERSLAVKRPQEIQPLEARFNAIRGRIGAGLKGDILAKELAELRAEVASAIERSRSGGTFGTAFFASLVTILREGVEVILLLTMLIALVAKAGQPKALRAIRLGVIAAAVASLATAIGLNLVVSTSQGRTREQIEGWVLMLAAGVLFYVSYWLISQSESKRWTDFLKQQVKRGVAAGGFGTLGLTAFLAVYREGAETALMYQAMIAGQAGSKLGLAGVIAGLAAGMVGLGAIYALIRKSSVRLPLRTFFKLTGLVLFAMAVVFAGNGVFELQMAGILRTTPISWLGSGISWLGLYPNIQALSVQGLILAGAIVALVILATDRGEVRPSSVAEPVREKVVA
jgi:high-affinity iron transporter